MPLNNHVRTSIAGLSFQLISVVSAFVLTPVLLAGLGSQLFGIWALLNAVRGYESLSDLGIPGAVVMFVSGSRGRQERSSLITTALLANLATTVAAVLVLLALKHEIVVRLFQAPPELLHVTEGAYTTMVLSCLFLVFVRSLAGVLGALQRPDLQLAIDTTIVALASVLTLAAIRRGGGLVEVSQVAFGTAALQAALLAVGAWRAYPAFRPRLGAPRPVLLRGLRYALKGQGADLGLAVSDPLLKSMVAGVSGAEAVGKLQVGGSLALLPSSASYAMQANLFPAVARCYSAGDSRGASRLLGRYMIFAAGLTLPVSGFLFVGAPALVALWLHSVDPFVVTCTRLLTVAYAIRSICLTVPWRVLLGLERSQDCSLAMLVHIGSLALGVFGLMVVARLSAIGILGAFLVSYAAASAFLWRRLRRSLPVFFDSDGKRTVPVIVRLGLIAAAMAGLHGYLVRSLSAAGVALLVGFGIMLLSYLLMVLALPAGERAELLRLAAQTVAGARQSLRRIYWESRGQETRFP